MLPQVDGDFAKFIMPTIQGLPSKGTTKLSESERGDAVFILGSQTQAILLVFVKITINLWPSLAVG